MKKLEDEKTPRHFEKGEAEKAQDAAEKIIDPAMPAAGAGLMIEFDPHLNQVSETEEELKRLAETEEDAKEELQGKKGNPSALTRQLGDQSVLNAFRIS